MSLARPNLLVLAASLLSVFSIAAVVRFVALDYGLPHTVYVDSFRFVHAASELVAGSYNQPSDYAYPELFKWLSGLAFHVTAPADVHAQHLTVRMLAAVAGVVSVVLVWFIGLRLSDVTGATLAAALYAVCVVPVRASRIEAADTWTDVFMLATVALLLVLSPRQRPPASVWVYLGAGLLTGLAAGTKFTGAFAGLAIVLAGLWLAIHQRRVVGPAVRIGGAGVLAIAVLLTCTPWFLEFPYRYLDGWTHQYHVQAFGQIGRIQDSALAYFFGGGVTPEAPLIPLSLSGLLGWPCAIAVLSALLLAVSGRLGPAACVVGVYAVMYLWMIAGEGRVHAARYLLPVLPLLFVMTGIAASWCIDRIQNRYRSLVTLLVFAVLLSQPLVLTFSYVHASTRGLTNDAAFVWAMQNIPVGDRVVLAPLFVHNLRHLPVRSFEIAGGERQYRNTGIDGQAADEHPVYTPALLETIRAGGAQWLVLTDGYEAGLKDTVANRRWFPRAVAAYALFRADLDATATRRFEIDGRKLGLLGPNITIYQFR